MELIPLAGDVSKGSTKEGKAIHSGIIVDEVYLDGKLKKAELIDEDDKSYGIFMHSLILSNYTEIIKVNNREINVIGDEYEKAIFRFAASKGFNKDLIESIAPRVSELTFDYDENLKVSTHIINEKFRIISKGTPEQLLKRCSYILMDSNFVKISRKIFKEVNAKLKEMLERSYSVYAIAIKDISKISRAYCKDNIISDMALVALVGMSLA